MYFESDAANFALLGARVWIAFMVFMHGWRHLKALRSGPGMANWFESLGLKPGAFHAWNVTLTELAFPGLLALGFLTPFAYGGVAALMLVAYMTNHRKNGFFLTSAKEGYEYVVTVAVVSIALGALGPGQWSLDDAFDLSFPFDPEKALAVAAIVGIGGAAAFLAVFWRPPKQAVEEG
ncbi:MAG: DoxX family protein [Acidimicrobiia bacterium]